MSDEPLSLAELRELESILIGRRVWAAGPPYKMDEVFGLLPAVRELIAIREAEAETKKEFKANGF